MVVCVALQWIPCSAGVNGYNSLAPFVSNVYQMIRNEGVNEMAQFNYGENTKAGKAERALHQLMDEGALGSGVIRQYLDAADDESLERLYDIFRR